MGLINKDIIKRMKHNKEHPLWQTKLLSDMTKAANKVAKNSMYGSANYLVVSSAISKLWG